MKKLSCYMKSNKIYSNIFVNHRWQKIINHKNNTVKNYQNTFQNTLRNWCHSKYFHCWRHAYQELKCVLFKRRGKQIRKKIS